MAVSQISVFVENKFGHLARILEIFEAASINVRGFLASDTGDYGIVRFVLDDPERGLAVLRENQCVAKLSQILCVRLRDTPGELARVMKVIGAAGVNVIYTYSLISTIIAIHAEDINLAESLLKNQPIELVDQAEISQTI
jgi:hypothetical protein